MQILLPFVLLVHGLLHLLGFVKAFELGPSGQLTLPVSRMAGIAWLIACLLFVGAATVHYLGLSYWWIPLLAGAVMSQILIIRYWKDAGFGTIPNAIVLVIGVIGLSTWNFHRSYTHDVASQSEQSADSSVEVLTESDLTHLPAPLQRYLMYTGSVGKARVTNFRIGFSGRIRKDAQSEWMSFTSEQVSFLDPSSRHFFMNATMHRMPVAGYHRYAEGSAHMDIRLFSLIPVQYMEGKEMDVAETVTFFNDMCCLAPATLIDRRIQWETIDSTQVKAVFTNGTHAVTAWLHFNEVGQLINFISDDRYDYSAGKRVRWSTPLSDYRTINGMRLPGHAETVYHYAEGDFTYGIFDMDSVEYNVTPR